MSLANFNPFRIAKAFVTFESSNEKTCQQLAATTTTSLSLTTTPVPHIPPLSDLLREHLACNNH